MMKCNKCGNTFDDKDGEMYVYDSKISDMGSPYIWICKGCDSTLDDRQRDEIFRTIHLKEEAQTRTKIKKKTKRNLLVLFIVIGGAFLFLHPLIFPGMYADELARVLMCVVGLVIFMSCLPGFVDMIKEFVYK